VVGRYLLEYAQTLSNLGALYHRTGRLARSIQCAEEALALRREMLGAHPDVATSANNLATLYAVSGRHDDAKELWTEALQIARETLGPYHPSIADRLRDLAVESIRAHDVDGALDLMEQIAFVDDHVLGQIFSVGSEDVRFKQIHQVRRNTDLLFSLVQKYCLQSSPIVQALRQQLDAEPDADLPAGQRPRDFIERWRRRGERAAADVLLQRKAMNLEHFTVLRDAILSGEHEAFAPRFRAILALRTRLAQKTFAGAGPEGPEAHRDNLRRWQKEVTELEEQLGRDVPELNNERRFRAVESRAVARALPRDCVLIDFVRFHSFTAQPPGPHYLALVTPGQRPNDLRIIDCGPAESIDRLVAAFRAEVTGDRSEDPDRAMRPIGRAGSPAQVAGAGQALRAAVFDALVPAFGSATRVLISPDGSLLRLPFQILPLGGGRHLIDEYHISYVGCGRDVLHFQARPAGQAAEPVVAADPDFDLCGGAVRGAAASAGLRSGDLRRACRGFDPLPGTRREGEAVARLLGVRPLMQKEVVEGQIKRVRSPWILHLATHGFFLADQADGGDGAAGGDRFAELHLENPLLRSGLALAGGNTWVRKGSLPPEAEDGLLTAGDVTGLDLLHTQMVVLSACDTGLGEIRNGEGVFGLRRAFVLAGAKTLVMSLWKVPDAETVELMEDFYHRVLAGQPRADALRDAQMTVKARHPDPYCWGAFVCEGNPGPLPAH
jgi:CHAT domain-containing protein/tetratricopeptide (TPR) repeat protein